MDIQNHYYGHSSALALGAHMDGLRHIRGLVQHGWTVKSPSLVHFADFASLPKGAKRLVWTHESRGWSPDDDPYDTTPIGAPFLYLHELTKERTVEASGVAVAFPIHDTKLVRLSDDVHEFARLLREKEGPSIVCLHPEDLDNPERTRVWAQYGHTVVSAGERRDSRFLGRVLRLVRSAKRVVSNQLSTAVMYAAAVGTPTAIYGSDIAIGSLGTEVAQRTRELWPEFYAQSSPEVLTPIALKELGSASVMGPGDLREALGWERRHAGPFFSYWAGAPIRKAGAVLGLVDRPEGSQDAGSGASPLLFVRHPLSHLPGPLPSLPALGELLPAPLLPAA